VKVQLDEVIVTFTGDDVVLSKEAVTLLSVFIWIIHAPVPVHAPDQPVKMEPESGVAVRVTDAFPLLSVGIIILSEQSFTVPTKLGIP
jgi:hypothetical protein